MGARAAFMAGNAISARRWRTAWGRRRPSRGEHPEDRVLGGDLAHLRVAGVRAHAFEEHADLGLPALQVGTQDRHLLPVADLERAERLAMAAANQPSLAADPNVAHPLGVPAGRDQVALAVEDEQVHRRAPPLPRASALDLEHARAPDADPQTREPRDDAVEDVLGEPAGALEMAVGGRLHAPVELLGYRQERLVAADVAPRARPLLAVGRGLLGPGAGFCEPALERAAVQTLRRDRLLDEQQRLVLRELQVSLGLREAQDLILGAVQPQLRGLEDREQGLVPGQDPDH